MTKKMIFIMDVTEYHILIQKLQDTKYFNSGPRDDNTFVNDTCNLKSITNRTFL